MSRVTANIFFKDGLIASNILHLYLFCIIVMSLTLSLLEVTSVVCWYSLQTVWTQFRPTKCQSWSGSRPFDTLIVFLKHFFLLKKVNFKKSQQTTTKACKEINVMIKETVHVMYSKGAICVLPKIDNQTPYLTAILNAWLILCFSYLLSSHRFEFPDFFSEYLYPWWYL